MQTAHNGRKLSEEKTASSKMAQEKMAVGSTCISTGLILKYNLRTATLLIAIVVLGSSYFTADAQSKVGTQPGKTSNIGVRSGTGATSATSAGGDSNLPGLPGDTDSLRRSSGTPGEVVSDMKLGSVLFYNYYVSDSLSSSINTRISLTNVNSLQDIAVHVFLIDSTSCNTADFFICLTRNQTTTFILSDVDPDTAGYIVAVAVDSQGKPTNFNYLAGEEYAVTPTGHRYGLSAIAAARLDAANSSSPVNSDGISSSLFFNGIQYDYLPQTVMIDSFPSQTSSPGSAIGDTRMYVYTPLTSLVTAGRSFAGTIFFLIFDDQENSFSGQLALNCYIASDKQRISSVRTAPNLSTIVPTGRTGWARFYTVGSYTVASNTTGGTKVLTGSPVLGASATRMGAFNGGRNLRYLTTFAQGFSITIPLVTPDCGPTNFLPTPNGSSI